MSTLCSGELKMQGYCNVFKRTILKRMSPKVKCVHLTSSRCKMRMSSVRNLINHKFSHIYSILFYPITLEGHRGTTDEFATIPFHFVLFSAALVELAAKSIPVHSLMLSPTSSSVCLFFFFLSLCPVGLSLLNQKTLKHGQTILAFVS